MNKALTAREVGTGDTGTSSFTYSGATAAEYTGANGASAGTTGTEASAAAPCEAAAPPLGDGAALEAAEAGERATGSVGAGGDLRSDGLAAAPKRKGEKFTKRVQKVGTRRRCC